MGGKKDIVFRNVSSHVWVVQLKHIEELSYKYVVFP